MGFNVSNLGTRIDGGTSLVIKTGNESSNKILVASADGLVDWVGIGGAHSTEHYVGELYGGGIVAAVWIEGGDEKVLITSLADATTTDNNVGSGFPSYTTAVWVGGSNLSTLVSGGAQSMYDGNSNMIAIKDQELTSGIGAILSPAAINFNSPGNGYNDWYLPSVYEMGAVVGAASVINKVLGEGNIKQDGAYSASASYWTSTEINAGSAWIYDGYTGVFASASKSTYARIRPVRMERRVISNGLITNLDASKKLSYNDDVLPGRWTDLVYGGMTSSYSFTFSTTGVTYSSDYGGYLSMLGLTSSSSYINFTTQVGSTGVITVEFWARLDPTNYTLAGSGRFMFGFNSYSVYSLSGGLGFNTGNGDLFGISSGQLTALGVLGTWAHYVFVMRSDVSYTNNKIYINGQNQTLSQVVTGTGENASARNFNSGIGRICGIMGGIDRPMDMDCSVFRIYKRALTQSEITESFGKYSRRYEVSVSGTHTITTSTVSVSQNLLLNIPGKSGSRLLMSSSLGTASWVDRNYIYRRPNNEKRIGELYGGGVVVAKWNYPLNVTNYLIMSTVDISGSSVWSNVTSGNIYGSNPASVTSDFDGATASQFIISQASHTTSAALLCANYNGFGYTDWYLPSIFELKQSQINLATIGYTTGTNSFAGRYWSSSQNVSDNTKAWSMSIGGGLQSGTQFIESKSTGNKVRAFRNVSVLTDYKTWTQPNPWDAVPNGWYTNPWDDKVWKPFKDIRRSGLVLEFKTDNVDCIDGRFSGYTGTAKDLVSGSASSVLTGVTWSSTDNSLVFNGTYSSITPTSPSYVGPFTRDSYVDLGDRITRLGLTLPITVETWINPSFPVAYLDTNTPFSRGIFTADSIESYGTNYYGVDVQIGMNSGSNTYNISAGFYTGGAQGSSSRRSGSTTNFPINANVWSHVVCVLVSTTDIRIYVNGVSQSVTISGTGTTLGWSNGLGKAAIGRTAGGYRYIFGGKIGLVRMYNVALDTDAITDHFEKDRLRYGYSL